MNHPHSIFTLPEQQLTPPEFPEWTSADKREAVSSLVDRIITDSEPWDENLEGWRGDMFVTWESLMLQCEQGKLDRDECMARMRDALYSHVKRHAMDEVQHDPDKYCEANDD